MGKELDPKWQWERMLNDNKARLKRLAADYNPITGEGADLNHPITNENIYYRKKVEIPDHIIPVEWLPYETRRNKLYKSVLRYGSIKKYIEEELEEDAEDDDIVTSVQRALLETRYRTDFMCWAYLEWRIKDKKGKSENVVALDSEEDINAIKMSYMNGSLIPFKLNCAQQKLLAVFEQMRLKNLPIRVILDKCRQWGGSTLTQVYMAWIQLMLKNSWYSVIVAQVSSTAKKIQMMYDKGIQQYSPWLLGLPDGERLRFSQYGRSASDFRITYGVTSNPQTARDAVISVATYNNPDSMPGSDMAMAHLSELALWKTTEGKTPEDLFRSVAGGIMPLPLTMIVIESTPRGSGNFFAQEFDRAMNHNSAYTPIFVSPAYNPYDTMEIPDKRGFAQWIYDNRKVREKPEVIFGTKKQCRVSGEFIWRMWDKLDFTLEGIYWYLHKCLEFSRHSDMASEAPVDVIESFANTDSLAFDMYDIDELEALGVKDPIKIGDIYSDYSLGKDVLDDYKFEEKPNGTMKIWEEPSATKLTDQYIVVVDIGGRWEKADWSIIRVLDRSDMMHGGMEKTSLMWHGHIPHEHLAWKAAQVAKWYNNALLVFESNTLETRDKNRDVDDGEQINYILEELDYCYENLYCRREKQAEDITGSGGQMKYGFHTNRRTKPLVVKTLDAAIRNKDYIERDAMTIDEFRHYERNGGVYEAMSGHKDDRLMTAGIALYLSRSPEFGLDTPRPIKKDKELNEKHEFNNTHGEASI